MKESVFDPVYLKNWRKSWGGKQTIESFKVHNLRDVEAKYWTFLNGLEMYLEVDNFILVHAGLDFRNENPLTITNEMMFIRNWHHKINEEWLGDRYIIHGHTQSDEWRSKRCY